MFCILLIFFQYVKILNAVSRIIYLWWLYQGCSPLPIPNREVKPLKADGTAKKCGRVGSRHSYLSLINFDEAFLCLLFIVFSFLDFIFEYGTTLSLAYGFAKKCGRVGSCHSFGVTIGLLRIFCIVNF
jgi:hypothetical protein